MHISEGDSFKLLERKGLYLCREEDSETKDYFLTVTFDRNTCKPCVIRSYSIGGEIAHHHARSHTLEMTSTEHAGASRLLEVVEQVLVDFGISKTIETGETIHRSVEKILQSLVKIFLDKEAFSLVVRVALKQSPSPHFEIVRANFEFDDAAHRSGRHTDIQAVRDSSGENAVELEAEKDGIVYVK